MNGDYFHDSSPILFAGTKATSELMGPSSVPESYLSINGLLSDPL